MRLPASLRTRPLRLAALPAAALAGVVLAAGPAAASAGPITVKSGVAGQQVEVASYSTLQSNSVLTVSAQLNVPTGSTNLYVLQPGDSTGYVVANGSAITSGHVLTWNLDMSCVSLPSSQPCAPALNGDWEFGLQSAGAGGATSCCFHLTFAVPPAPVSSVSGSAAGTVATIGWAANSEPDVVAYDVLTSADQPVVSGLSPSQYCSGGSCAVSFAAGASAAGTTRSYVVRAERSSCPSCSSTLTSTDSQPASVTFPAAPAPSPSASGSSSPGSSPGTRGTGAGGSGATLSSPGHAVAPPPPRTRAGGHPLPLSFSDLAAGPAALPPSLQLPLPQGATAPLPGPDTGGYSPLLAYPAQQPQLAAPPASRPTTTRTSLQHYVTVASSSPPIWRTLAIGVLLLLVAGHLHAWARRRPADAWGATPR